MNWPLSVAVRKNTLFWLIKESKTTETMTFGGFGTLELSWQSNQNYNDFKQPAFACPICQLDLELVEPVLNVQGPFFWFREIWLCQPGSSDQAIKGLWQRKFQNRQLILEAGFMSDSNSDRTKIPTSDAKILDIGCGEKAITPKTTRSYPRLLSMHLIFQRNLCN